MKFPDIDPVLIHLGPLEIRWYALFYIISFVIGYIFIKRNYKEKGIELSKEGYENLIFYIMLGVILGGRAGYVVFYNFAYYLQHPLEVIWPFKDGQFVGISGMSFHGGALGVIAAGLIFCRKYKLSFYQYADPVMPLVAIGLGLGRLGNFINAELYGRITTVPWGIVFPGTNGQPRHPSQLYEMFLEGVIMFAVLQYLNKKSLRHGIVFWAFIGLYGIFRFVLEFVRQPDAHMPNHGFLIGFLTMGQILSFVMLITAFAAMIRIYMRRESNETS